MTDTLETLHVREEQSGLMVEINPHRVCFVVSLGDGRSRVVFGKDHEITVMVDANRLSRQFSHIFGKPGKIDKP